MDKFELKFYFIIYIAVIFYTWDTFFNVLEVDLFINKISACHP